MPPETLAIMAVFYVVFLLARARAKPLSLRPPPPPPRGLPEGRGESVRRVLKHIQRSTIADLKEGDAAVVEGIVRPLAHITPLTSPVYRIGCIGFHVNVRATQVHDFARCVDFEVVDATGSLLISAQGLELAITGAPPATWYPPLHPALLAVVPPSFQHEAVTIEEGLLQPGMRVLVCGVATRELAATDYRDGKPTLVLRASATFPLVASTDEDLLTPGDRPYRPEELRRERGGSDPDRR